MITELNVKAALNAIFGVAGILEELEKRNNVEFIKLPPEKFEAFCNSENVKQIIELEQKAKEFFKKLNKRSVEDEDAESFCKRCNERIWEVLAKLAAHKSEDEEREELIKLVDEYCFLTEELTRMTEKVSDQYKNIVHYALRATIKKFDDILEEYHTILDEAYSQLPLEELEIFCNTEDAKLIIEIEQRIDGLAKIESKGGLTEDERFELLKEDIILKQKVIEPITRFKEELKKRLERKTRKKANKNKHNSK